MENVIYAIMSIFIGASFGLAGALIFVIRERIDAIDDILRMMQRELRRVSEDAVTYDQFVKKMKQYDDAIESLSVQTVHMDGPRVRSDEKK